MIRISLDTGALEKKQIRIEKGPLIELLNLQKQGKVLLYADSFAILESRNLRNDDGDRILRWAQENTRYCIPKCSVDIKASEEEKRSQVRENLRHSTQKSDEIRKRVANVLLKHNSKNNPYSLNDYIDISLLAEHILEKRDYFITTNPKDFIREGKRNIKEELEQEFQGLKVRELNEKFLNEISSKI